MMIIIVTLYTRSWYNNLPTGLFMMSYDLLQLVHCAYECPSIMDSVKVDYSKRDTIDVKPDSGF